MTHHHSYFANTVCIVTGGGSGIGKAIAHKLEQRGSRVVAMDIDSDALALAASEIPLAAAVVGDVSLLADCQRVARVAGDLNLPVRMLVNSAAFFGAYGVDASPENWDRSLGVNVKGVALMSSCVVPLMKASGGGAIINVASISGYVAQPNRWTYNASKGAVLSLTRCQALDLARYGIRVNSVSPGTIWTPELDRMTNSERDKWAPILGREHILNRVGEPQEVADAVLFLASPEAGFITGTDLLVDGGYVAMGHSHDDSLPDYSQ